MRQSLWIIALVFAAIVAPTDLKAAGITYTVNQPVGTGSVVGTITTNGTIGTLTSSDITGWALTLSDGTNTLNISSVSATAITQAPIPPSTDLTATPSALLFNFSSSDSAFFILGLTTVPGNGGEVTWESIGAGQNIHIFDINGDNIYLTTPTLVGNQVIATAAGTSSGCGVTLAPTGQAFGPMSGLGSFGVTTGVNCNWRATTSDSWITLFPGVFVCAPTLPSCPTPPAGTGKVLFSVAANSTGVARTGNISVGNQTFNVTQNAVGSTCRISVGPLQDTLTDTGGNFHINVTIVDGSECQWTAVSDTNWLTVTSAASGSGNASVSVHAAPNNGAPRSGTLTIAGATVSITEGAAPCGAVDITSHVGINEGSLNFIWPGEFSQSIAVTNRSGSVIPGPVFLVTLGEPTNYGYPNDSGLLGGGAVTHCFSPNGDYLILVSGGLQPGQSVGVPLAWFTQTFNPGVRYTIKVLSGQPNK